MSDTNPQQQDTVQRATAEGSSDPDQLRAEIDATREELGDTVEALAEKADVKTRVHEKVDERKEAAQEKVASVQSTAEENKTPMIAAGIGALLLLLFLIRRR